MACECEAAPEGALLTAGLICGGAYWFAGCFWTNLEAVVSGRPSWFFVAWGVLTLLMAWTMARGLVRNMHDHDPGFGVMGLVIGIGCAYALYHHMYPDYLWKSVLISVLVMCMVGCGMTVASIRHRVRARRTARTPTAEPMVEYIWPDAPARDDQLRTLMERNQELEDMMGLTAVRAAAIEHLRRTGAMQQVTFEPVWNIPSPRMKECAR
jgi:hypothetical protein